MKVFKDRLKKVMVDQNINQVELSRICGVSRSTVSKWMSGDSEPTKARRNEIAEAFDLPENYFEEIVIPKKKNRDVNPERSCIFNGDECWINTKRTDSRNFSMGICNPDE